VRVVLDTTILVRGHERASGPARELLLALLENEHTLLVSNEILHELARVLRYPRMLALYRLSEDLIYSYIGFLRSSAEIVQLNPLLIAPVRDANDIVVMQTAILGEATILCSADDDFFQTPAREYLASLGISVVDDVALMRQLRSKQ
jgi:putative PIN family toxin of toxin-antitoxin system